MKLLAKAIIQVMKTVKSIDKGMTIGKGDYAYKGVADKDVKHAIGQAMQDNGLCLIPTSVDQTVQVDRWQEEEYGKLKQKQSVFTEVKTKYLLLHESGESIEVAGYGQGVDSQDKSAGKATTYALKYALLYLFMVPTGNIDDADKSHSNDVAAPPKKVAVKPTPTKDQFNGIVAYLKGTSDQKEQATSALRRYSLTLEQTEQINKL
jgi:hypothetical protein